MAIFYKGKAKEWLKYAKKVKTAISYQVEVVDLTTDKKTVLKTTQSLGDWVNLELCNDEYIHLN